MISAPCNHGSKIKRLSALTTFFLGALLLSGMLFTGLSPVFAANVLQSEIQVYAKFKFNTSTDNYVPVGTKITVTGTRLSGTPNTTSTITTSNRNPGTSGQVMFTTGTSGNIPNVVDTSILKFSVIGSGILPNSTKVKDCDNLGSISGTDSCMVTGNPPDCGMGGCDIYLEVELDEFPIQDLKLTVTPPNLFLNGTDITYTITSVPPENIVSGPFKLVINSTPTTAYTDPNFSHTITVTPPTGCSSAIPSPALTNKLTYGNPSPVVITVPYFTSETTQPCVGTHTVKSLVTYELRYSDDNVLIGTFAPPYSITKSVVVMDSADLVTLKVHYINAVDGTPINTALGDGPTLTVVTPPDPKAPLYTGPTESGNTEELREIFPTFYRVEIPAPKNFYKNIPIVISSYDLSSDKEEDAKFCPLLPPEMETECNLDPDVDPSCSCTNGTTMEVTDPPPLPTTETPSPSPDATPSCLPDEMQDSLGALGWFLRPVFDMLCTVISINAEIAFPLLDVNVPLAESDGSGGTRLVLRQMFNQDTISDSAGASTTGNGLADVVRGLIPEALTPPEVYDIWEIGRNISFTGVILAMVLMAFMVMFRADTNKYSTKSLLTNALIGVVLAGMSYQICTFVLDLGRIMALVAKDILSGIFDSAGGTAGGGMDMQQIISYLPTVLIGVGGAVAGVSFAAAILPCLFLLGGYLVALIALFAALILRLLFIYMMVAVSPIIFILAIIPDLQKMRADWFKSFFAVVMVYPLIVMLYYLLLTLSQLF